MTDEIVTLKIYGGEIEVERGVKCVQCGKHSRLGEPIGHFPTCSFSVGVPLFQELTLADLVDAYIFGTGFRAIDGKVLSRETVGNEKGRARPGRLAPAPREERNTHGTQ